MPRCRASVTLLLFVGLWLPLRGYGQAGQRLCSGGTADGRSCSSMTQCPEGVCVVAQGICDGGRDGGLDCDCPGSTCESSPACLSDPDAGTCAGGAYAGECCDTRYNCADDAPCRGTQKVCLAGELKGFSCLVEAHCGGNVCASTGRVCTGDGFSCVDSSDCISGTCEGTFPTPKPTPAESCVGDCDGDGAVTIDNLLLMANVALEAQRLSVCQAGDLNRDGVITVDEIVTAVNNALNECPAPQARRRHDL